MSEQILYQLQDENQEDSLFGFRDDAYPDLKDTQDKNIFTDPKFFLDKK
jgi:hypothetical protein